MRGPVSDGGHAVHHAVHPGDFDQPLGLAVGLGDGVCAEVCAGNSYGFALGRKFGGGVPGAHDLDGAVDAARNGAWRVGRDRFTQRVQHGVAALMLGRVGQQGAAVDIADGVDVRCCPQKVVGSDPARAGHGDACLIEPEARSVRFAPNRDQSLVDPDLSIVLQPHQDRFALIDESGHPFAGDDVPFFAFEHPAQGLRNFLVLGGGDAGGGFDDVDRRAQAVPEVGHFEADGPGSDDRETGGRFVEVKQIRGVENPRVIGFKPRKPVRGRARGYDERREAQRLFSLAGDTHRVFIDQGRLTKDQGDPMFLKTAPHGLVGRSDKGVFSFLESAHVHLHGPAAQAQARLGVQALQVGGGSEVEFGGDASPVEAGPAEVLPLDEGDRFSSLTGEQSCGITARSRSYDNDVKMAHVNSRVAEMKGHANKKVYSEAGWNSTLGAAPWAGPKSDDRVAFLSARAGRS